MPIYKVYVGCAEGSRIRVVTVRDARTSARACELAIERVPHHAPYVRALERDGECYPVPWRFKGPQELLELARVVYRNTEFGADDAVIRGQGVRAWLCLCEALAD